MIERFPESEFSAREKEIIGILREKGPDDPEAQRLFLRWYMDEEAKAVASPDINPGDAERANIRLELKKAKLYRAAGGYQSAWETLEAVRIAAHGIGSEELYNAAMALMDEIDAEESKG